MLWISTSSLTADAIRLAGKLPPDIAGVAGVPRSGLIAAGIVAAHLHLPLYELSVSDASPRLLGFGARAQNFAFEARAGRIAVIDDLVWTGTAMRFLQDRQMRSATACLFAAVYATVEHAGLLDTYARLIPSERPLLAEWAVFNSAAMDSIALDLDGIICHDPTFPDADAGPGLERYAAWLGDATPLHLPRTTPTPLILTARLERWRPQTEAWLHRWRVRWDKLVMHPFDKASARGDVAAWKAGHFRASACKLFIESDPGQAERIAQLAGKPVVCPALPRVLLPGR